MKEIPVTKLTQLEITDDIALSCLAVLNVGLEATEVLVFGSSVGMITAVNINGSSSNIQSLNNMGKLCTMCTYDRGVLVCTVDGRCHRVNIKENSSNNQYKYKLETEYSFKVPSNSSFIRPFVADKEYIVIGTEEGVLEIYQLANAVPTTVATYNCDGAVLDVEIDLHSSFLHLFVSCEGYCGYEAYLVSNKLEVTTHELRHEKFPPHPHSVWLFPTATCCSCDKVAKCTCIQLSSSSMRLEVNIQGRVILVDEKGERYMVDIREPVESISAFSLQTPSKLPYIVMVCRTKFYFQIYTDILQYYNCLRGYYFC